MSEKKEVVFKILVDPQSMAQTRRAFQEILSGAQQVARALQGIGLGPGGGGVAGGSLGGAVGGPQSRAQMVSAARTPVGGGNGQQKGLAQVFIDNANNLKGLANVGRDSMRIMSEGIKRAVDDQKRSIGDLDNTLAKLSKRYETLRQGEQAVRAAYVGQGLSPDEARDLYQARLSGIETKAANLGASRAEKFKDLGTLDEQRRQAAIARDPYSQTGGPDDEEGPPGRFARMWSGFKGAMGAGARGKVVGGSIAAGILAGAGELTAQPFDFVTQQARQAQALGTMGVATRHGDLSYASALMSVMGDVNKRGEFMDVGERNISTGISSAGGSVMQGLMRGDPNVPGNILRAVEGLDSTMKERMRSYIEQEMAANPAFQFNLNKFQNEADSRVAFARRTGIGDINQSGIMDSTGEDLGTLQSAFESVRGGGRKFAQRGMFDALRAMRGGMDGGAAGGLLGAGAPTGTGAAALNVIITGVDPVASEHLAKGLAGAVEGSQFGPQNATSFARAMMAGRGENAALDVYESRKMGAAIPALGALLGGGTDTLGTGLNVLAANKAVGPGGDLYTVNALSQLGQNPVQLLNAMKGDISPEMAAMGITQEGAQSMFQNSLMRNMRARSIAQPGAKLSPASQAREDIVSKFGGDPRAWARSAIEGGMDPNDVLVRFGGVLSQEMPQTFGDTGMAKEAGRLLLSEEFGGPLGTNQGKKLGDAAYGSASGVLKRERIKSTEKEFKSFLEGEGDKLKELATNMSNIGTHFENMGKLEISAGDAAKNLAALGVAANELIPKFRTMAGHPTAGTKDLEAAMLKSLQSISTGRATATKAEAAAIKSAYQRIETQGTGKWGGQ